MTDTEQLRIRTHSLTIPREENKPDMKHTDELPQFICVYVSWQVYIAPNRQLYFTTAICAAHKVLQADFITAQRTTIVLQQ